MGRLMMMSLLLIGITATSRVSAMATTTPPSSTIQTTTTKVSYQLKYFNGRGVAETIRLLFALGAAGDIDDGGDEDVDSTTKHKNYEDVRFDIIPGTMDSPSFQAAKANGELVMNMNRAPVLVVTEEEFSLEEEEEEDTMTAATTTTKTTNPTEVRSS